MLVAIAIDTIMLEAAGISASVLADKPEALSALREAIESTNWTPNPHDAFRGEAYAALAEYRQTTDKEIWDYTTGHFGGDHGYEEVDKRDFKNPVRTGLPRSRLSKAVAAEYMAFWNEFYPRLANPMEDRNRVAADMDVRGASYGSSGSRPQAVARLFLPRYIDVFKSLDRQQSEQRTVLAYMGLLQYRLKHQQWPASLKEAGVDAIDLMDGQPLRYKAQGDSARVWNIGRDGIDNGGLSSSEAAAKKISGHQSDRVYVYPWPPRPKSTAKSSSPGAPPKPVP